MEPKYATCLNCIDGRSQVPVIKWITLNYPFDFVDMITEPGMDGKLADENFNIDEILIKVDISIEAHNSKDIFVVGHYDCAANPTDKKTHIKQIKLAVERIKDLRPQSKVIGIWVESQDLVEFILEK